MERHEIKVIARIRSDFPTKFGIPRQSGLAQSLRARVVFEPEFRSDDALRGIEGFSHLWLIWQFSEAVREEFSPTVRPPRLGGNERLGVFATRSPFRPNAMGLSCVKLEGVEKTANEGTVLLVSGADLMDGTPIYDVKPYLPYADCKAEAVGGFAAEEPERLTVDFPEALAALFADDKRDALTEILALDPRPRYKADGERVYGLPFAGREVKFRVNGGVLSVISVE